MIETPANLIEPPVEVESNQAQTIGCTFGIFRSTRLPGGVFLRDEFTEAWFLSTSVNASDCTDHLGPADHLVLYHCGVEGALTIELDGLAATTILPGEAAIFPRNDRHRVYGRKAADVVSALDVGRKRRYDLDTSAKNSS